MCRHGSNVQHALRDKPGNVVNLVKLMSVWPAVLLLQIGTMNHMPPEMLRSGQMSVVSDTQQAGLTWLQLCGVYCCTCGVYCRT